jgi:cysteine desulfurase
LYKNNKFIIEKFIYGGNQERKFRSGTENTMGVFGAGLAIDKLRIEKFNKELPNYLIKRLTMLEFINHVNSDTKKLSSIVSITFPNIYAQTLIETLSQLNVYISSGSACKQGEKIPSYVLLKSGYSIEHALCTIRVSFGIINSIMEIDNFILHLKNALHKISKLKGD